jgi:hypothetical protein
MRAIHPQRAHALRVHLSRRSPEIARQPLSQGRLGPRVLYPSNRTCRDYLGVLERKRREVITHPNAKTTSPPQVTVQLDRIPLWLFELPAGGRPRIVEHQLHPSEDLGEIGFVDHQRRH